MQDEWRRRTALLSLCGSAIPSRAWGKGKFLLFITVLFFKSNIYLVLDDCVPFRLPDNISKAAYSKHSKECCDDTACTCALKKRPQVAAYCMCFLFIIFISKIVWNKCTKYFPPYKLSFKAKGINSTVHKHGDKRTRNENTAILRSHDQLNSTHLSC